MKLDRFLAAVLLLCMLFSMLLSCELVPYDDPAPSPDGGTSDGDGDGDEAGGDGDLMMTLHINEVCSKNTTTKAPDGGKYDWIELHNPTDEEISLSGFGISDRKGKVKHTFRDGVKIAAGKYLVLWACGEENTLDKPEGGVYLPFAISAQGEEIYLFNSMGIVLDRMTVPALDDDRSYGYSLDGKGVLGVLTPSCGTSNKQSKLHQLSDDVVGFSHESGFYGAGFTLTLDLPEGYTAYYTTDCSTPSKYKEVFPTEGISITDVSPTANQYSNLYVGNMDMAYEGYTKDQLPTDPVDKCTVVRVVVYDKSGRATGTITKTYFVDYDAKSGYANVPIVSIASTPSELYGADGLFTNKEYWSKGTDAEERANERRVSFTYFDGEHTYSFDQEVGLRLHGTSTRAQSQKSMTLFARQSYGNKAFEKVIVGDAKECRSMVLRADGKSKIQEGFLQSLVSERELSTCDYTPCVVFIDGEYAGVYNLYERFSDDYVEEYYGIDNDNVYIVKKGSEGNVDGAKAAYQDMYNKLCYLSASGTANYNTLASLVDMQSLIELMCAQIYLCNADFDVDQNIAAWRVIDPSLEDPNNPYADGKWRFVIYDLDISIGAWAPALNMTKFDTRINSYVCDYTTNGFTQQGLWTWAVPMELAPIVNLMKNPTFKRTFALTFQDMVNVDFERTRVLEKLEAALDVYEPLMEKHFARYGVPVNEYATGNAEGSSNSDWKIVEWFGGSSTCTPVTGAMWRQEMQFAVDFFDRHGAYALQHLKEVFALSGSLVTATVTAGQGGAVYLNGNTQIPFGEDGTWSGTYYTDYAPLVTAVPAEGYTFAGWVVTGGATLPSLTDAEVRLTSVTGDYTLTATFTPVTPVS